MLPENADKVRDEVREYYAGLARQGVRAQDCCGGGSASLACCSASVADPSEGSPSREPLLSLGCADPISAAALQPGEIMLDLGSGGGLDCILAAKQVGQTGRVIGVDMTQEMLERARRSAERAGVSNVEFRMGLIEALPIEDESADVVVSNCVINLSPDKRAVFRELARVLRPGGRLVVADIVTRGALLPELGQGKDSWAACVAGALAVEDYVSGLRGAGLAGIAIQAADGASLADVPEGLPFSAIIAARKP